MNRNKLITAFQGVLLFICFLSMGLQPAHAKNLPGANCEDKVVIAGVIGRYQERNFGSFPLNDDLLMAMNRGDISQGEWKAAQPVMMFLAMNKINDGPGTAKTAVRKACAAKKL